jgi:malonyl-CoA O-methyltransferase
MAMSAPECPPSLDPIAAARWSELSAGLSSPWLHEEVASRMQERLAFIKLQPAHWVHWGALQGGLQAHAALQRRYPKAQVWLSSEHQQQSLAAHEILKGRWWHAKSWLGPSLQHGLPPDGQANMLWANMQLHTSAHPQNLLKTWHKALAVDGFLMFSCLGPDTFRELRNVYIRHGWPQPAHEFTDMHDWGDMLVEAGFAEPVMDMERMTLSYESPQRLLAELRSWGRNLNVQRFQGLRGRHWLDQLNQALMMLARPEEGGRLTLTFEIVYGHALKPSPRVPVSTHTVIGLEQMQQMLRTSPRIADKV